MCPNMKRAEWLSLRETHPDLFLKAKLIEISAIQAGNGGRGNSGLYKGTLANLDKETQEKIKEDKILEDRCHHGGCFT